MSSCIYLFDHILLQSFDDLQLSVLQHLLNIKVDECAGFQASLPVCFGGLSVVSTARVASSAYIASKLSCTILSLPMDPEGKEFLEELGEVASSNWGVSIRIL